MTSPTPSAAVPPSGGSAPGASVTTHRPNAFFDWIREAGIVRTRGWLGGVAAGIATRTGIDAALIRGILVAITLLGFPAVLLYAILWLVLPDENDAIALQQLFRGRFQPQMIGIVATFLFAMVPFTSLISRAWQALTQPAMVVSVGTSDGVTYYSDPAYGWDWTTTSVLPILMTLGAIALAIVAAVLIVAAARRRSIAAPAASSTVPAASMATAPVGPAGVVTGVDETVIAAEPASPIDEAPTDPDKFAQWREQHAQTQRDREAFLVSQQDDQAAKERAAQEHAAARGAFLRQLSARRAERRATNPRASLGYNLGVVGAAVVVACVVILTHMDGGFTEALGLGAFGGAIVLALGMVAAGAMRRRSGFLALATVTALAVGGGATVATRPGSLVWDGASVFAGNMARVDQPFGALYVYTDPLNGSHEPLAITKGDGYTVIYVEAGTDLEFDAALGEGSNVSISIEKANGEYGGQDLVPVVRDGQQTYDVSIETYRADLESETQRITLEQTSGWVDIVVLPDWNNPDVASHIDPKITVQK